MPHILDVSALRQAPLASPGEGLARRARKAGAAFALQLREWYLRAHSRNELRTLNDRALRDIGCTRCDAERETKKFFWQE